MHAKRDKALNAELGLRNFESKKARAFVTCFSCAKRRMVYTKSGAEWRQNKLALQQKLESVGHRYSCGDLLWGDGPMSKVLVQRQSLTCESRIEAAYYNPKTPTSERKLGTRNICVHCGCGGDGSGDFLWTMKEMMEKNMTDGFTYFPVCVHCLKALGHKKGLVKHGTKRDALQARNEALAKVTSR